MRAFTRANGGSAPLLDERELHEVVLGTRSRGAELNQRAKQVADADRRADDVRVADAQAELAADEVDRDGFGPGCRVVEALILDLREQILSQDDRRVDEEPLHLRRAAVADEVDERELVRLVVRLEVLVVVLLDELNSFRESELSGLGPRLDRLHGARHRLDAVAGAIGEQSGIHSRRNDWCRRRGRARRGRVRVVVTKLNQKHENRSPFEQVEGEKTA